MHNVRTILAALLLALAPAQAVAQTTPNLRTGQVPTAAQWNNYFAAKQDLIQCVGPVLSNGGAGIQCGTLPNDSIKFPWLIIAGKTIQLGESATLACSDLTGAAASCSTNALDASNINAGTLSGARLPAPTATMLGGIKSASAPANQFQTGVSTDGLPIFAQPTVDDILGLPAAYTASGTNPATQLVQDRLRKIVLATDDSGVDFTGVTDSYVGINRLIAAGNVTLKFPCGTYKIGGTLSLPNGTVMDGQGCAKIVLAATMANDPMWNAGPGSGGNGKTGFANIDVAGNAGLIVKGFTIDGSGAPSNTHLIRFYKSTNVQVENNYCIGSTATGTPSNVQDCIAFVNSSRYTVQNNTCTFMRNACYDNWDGSTDGTIVNNYVDGWDGSINSLAYGVLLNGISTAYTANTSSRFTIRGNIIKNVGQVGIWVAGLYHSPTTTVGNVTDAVVANNVIQTSSLNGINVADAQRTMVSDNIVRNTGGDAIRVGSQFATGVTDTTTVANNIVEGSNTTSSGSGISIINAASNTTVSGNQILAGGSASENFAISASAGTTNTNIVNCGRMVAGGFGTFADGGTGGVRSCHDGSSFQITAPQSLKFGIAGADGQLTVDTGGNFYPAATNRNLGSASLPWRKVYSYSYYSPPNPPTPTAACATVDAGSSQTVGKITLAAATTSCQLTFATAYTTNVYCTVSPLTQPTSISEIPYISALAAASFTMSGGVATKSYTYHCGGN